MCKFQDWYREVESDLKDIQVDPELTDWQSILTKRDALSTELR